MSMKQVAIDNLRDEIRELLLDQLQVDGSNIEGDGLTTPLSAPGLQLARVDVDDIDATEDKFGEVVTLNCYFNDWTAGSPDDWINVNNPAKTEVSNGSGGSAAKIEYTDTTTPAIRQVGVLTVGQEYRCFYRVAGDGLAGLPRIYDGGAYVYTGTNSAVWDTGYFDFTASGTNIRLVAAGTTAPGEYALFDYVCVYPKRTVGNTDKKLNHEYFENLVIYSENLNNWPGNAVVDGNANEIIGTAVDTTHFRRIDVSVSDLVPCKYQFKVRRGAQQFARLLVTDNTGSTGLAGAYLDLDTGDLSLITAATRAISVEACDYDDFYDWCVKLEFDPVSTTRVYIWPTDASGDASYLGDGSTVDLYASEMQVAHGTIGDNIQYITTSGTANTGERRGVWNVDKQQKLDKGLLQASWATSDSDGWEVPQISNNSIQYVYRAPSADKSKYGANAKVMVFESLSNGNTLGTTTKIHGGTLIVSDGTDEFTGGLHIIDGTNEAKIKRVISSGEITVELTGFTSIVGGTIIFE